MTIATPATFALALKQVRQAHGMTQEALAAQSGVSVRSISDLERGISRFPHKDTVQLLVDALDLAPAEAQQLFALARSTKVPASDATAMTETELPFIGRDDELRAIHEHLTAPTLRLLTLVGVAGVGKTRLALATAATASNIFGDGVTVIDLASIQAAQYVVPLLAKGLGVREQGARSLLAAVVQAIADRRLLLVLDNCEHVLAARDEIAHLLAQCPSLTILATSREPLGLASEHVMAIRPLAIPTPQVPNDDAQLTRYAAVMLFVACVQAQHPDFTLTPILTRTIARICTRLEGIPLAIELAAARVPAMPPRAILAQLSGAARPMMLGWLHHDSTRPPRQQTLRHALAWSYRLLEAREQIVFRRLSVFATGWTPEDAEAVCDPHRTINADMHAILASLAHKSLVVQEASDDGAMRYSMHFVMRAFGAELLAERKEDAATQQAYAAYYATLVEGLEQGLTGATQTENLNRLIGDYENIRAALQWAREQDDAAIGLKLAGALWWFWENRGLLTEGRAWIEGMLAIWEQHPTTVDDEIVGRAYYGATILAITQGDRVNGQHFAEVCLRYLHAPAKRARVLLMLGNMAKFRGRPNEAIQHYTEGLRLLRAANEPKGLLVALNNLSTLYIERGDLATALPLLEESLALKRAVGDRRGVAVGLMNYGEVLKTQGHFQHARDITQEGYAIFEDLGDMQGLAMASNNLGEIAAVQGDDVQAATAFAASLSYYRRMEDRPGIAMALRHLGAAYARLGDAQAEAILREGADLSSALDDTVGAIECILALAAFDLRSHAPRVAQRELARIAAWLAGDQTGTLPDDLRQRYAALLAQASAT
jgi:predicted ATPase/DNA-binding XRE family transcriptional regulator